MPATKGTSSKTRRGRKNFSTKRGNKVYNPNGHYLTKTHRPYSFFKNSKSKTRRGRKNFTTKKSSRVFHRKGHNVTRKRRPYHKRR